MVSMKKEYDVVMLGSLIKRTDEEDSILNKASSSKVCRKVTRIFAQITIAIKISKSRLRRLLLSPIWMMLNIFSFIVDIFIIMYQIKIFKLFQKK